MTTTEDIADLTLHHMGRTGVQPFVVVIGAMDGVSYDDFHGYINMYQWSGLFVEPIPEQFRRLKDNYARLNYRPANKYENSAIADYDGTIRMLTINQNAVDQRLVHPCFGGMSAIYPPRNGLASAADAATVARYGEMIEVPCLTLATLFKRHSIDQVGLLCVDAEGWDYAVIRQLDFAAYRPKLIRCEYINLSADEKSALANLLTENGYVIRIDGQNIDAVTAEYWQEVQAGHRPAAVPVASNVRPRTVTLVTGVFDLSSGATDMQLRHRFGRYIDDVKRLLQVDWPMVIFAPPEFVEMLQRCRPSSKTYLVTKTLADLEAFPFSSRIHVIWKKAGGLERDKRTRNRPENRLPMYNLFSLSKQFFLNDAAIYNPFATEYFLWVDGDIAGAIGDPVAQLTDECRRNLSALLSGDRMLYIGGPIGRAADAPAFPRSKMAEFAGQEPAYFVRGRSFGGTRAAVNAMNNAYYSYLGATLNAGCMGTEEQVLTIISYTHRHLCNLQMLSPDGHLRTFFDRLQHGVPDQSEQLSQVSVADG